MNARSKSHSMLSGIGASALLSIVLAACGTPASLRVQYCANGIEAGFVEFPVWRLTPDQPFPFPDSFVGRLAGEGANQEILVRAGSRDAVLSLDCYAIRLQPPFPVRPARPSEWETAVAGALPGKQNVYRKHGSTPSLEFRGRTYKWQGQFRRETALSPGGRWLVHYSHDDGDWTRIGRGTGPFARGTPANGAAYFEVFDTATGNRVFVARTRWSDELTSGAVEWIGDQHLILTVNTYWPFHQRCLFVAFP